MTIIAYPSLVPRLMHAAPEVLKALELSEVHGNGLHPEERDRVSPVPLIGAGGGNDARGEPGDVGSLGEAGLDLGEHLGGDAAGSAEHGPSAMDDLRGRGRGIG